MKLNSLLGKIYSLILFSMTMNAQPKGYLYDESKIIPYELPDLLVCQDGTKVETAQTWIEKRRPEILKLFQEEVYGESPGNRIPMRIKMVEEGEDALGGKAIRKQVAILLGEANRTLSINLLLYLPKLSNQPLPAFLTLNFQGNHTVHSDPAILLPNTWVRNRNGIKDNRAREKDRGLAASRWAISDMIKRGYAFATVYYGDIDPDFDDGFQNGAHALFSQSDSEVRRPSDWGSIAGWAWGLSRCLDYLEKDPLIDSNRIAVMGHSRLGKTSLWAAVTDERFAMVISNNSGCGGAALSRRRFGETVKRINISFPHWFCENYKKYNDKEENCPVDQHMLIALAAPRPVYIASAEQDLWADPKGEFLSALHAEPVYQLFGKSFGARKQPMLNHPVHGQIGYHVRNGKHDVTAYDWNQYLNFADQHLK
jgi:hypothetical protein